MSSSAPHPLPLPGGLLRFGERTAIRRLYCVPYAGGGPATFRLWPRVLPDDIDVLAVQLPGRSPAREAPPVDSIEEIVVAVRTSIDELEAADPLPYAIFGHSMGALVAFELALALEAAEGSRPQQLFVSGRRPPDEVHLGEPTHLLPDDDFLAHIDRTYQAIPEAVRAEPELMALFLPSLRADIKALETYAPLSDERVTCPVRVFGGARDGNPRPSQLGGWQRLATQSISIRVFPGDHFYLNESRDALAADIADHL